MKSDYVRNAILAVALAVIAFFWIWFYEYLGAKAYWVALVAFGVCMAYGTEFRKAMPWATGGAALGAVWGLLTYVLFMTVFPLYYGLSVALAGAILILLAGLVSIPKMRELLPMMLVGWGCFLGAVARFDYLIAEKPIEAMHRAITNFIGVILSLLIGILIATVLDALVFAPRKEKAAAEAPAAPQAPEIPEE